jgi:hypothetical protein
VLGDQPLTNISNGSLSIPVIAGLAVGILFVVLFASFTNANESESRLIGKYPHFTLSVGGLKDSYSVNEPLNFTLTVSGYGAMCTQYPEILVSNSQHVLVWNYQTFNLMGCGDPDLTYPHRISHIWNTQVLDKPLYLDQPSEYTITATYYGETIEKRFSVYSDNASDNRPDLDMDENIDCKKYSDPASEPNVCLFARVPDMALNIAGHDIYHGDKGSFCSQDICVDTVVIVPEKLILIERGTEIDLETIGFRQPDEVGISLWKGVNRPASDLQLIQSTEDNSKFTADIPDGDYVLQVGANWMKGEYSEMSATYYYKVRVS